MHPRANYRLEAIRFGENVLCYQTLVDQSAIPDLGGVSCGYVLARDHKARSSDHRVMHHRGPLWLALNSCDLLTAVP